MVYMTGGCNDAVATVVAALVERLQIVGGKRLQRLGRAKNGVAVGMLRPEGFGMELEDEIVRRIGDPVDLLQDDVSFRLEIALAQQGMADQIGEDLDCQGQVRVENMSLVAGVVSAGECVEASAADLQLQSELLGGPTLGAFEDHVLEQM